LKTWQASQVGRVRLHLILEHEVSKHGRELHDTTHLSLAAALAVHGLARLVGDAAGGEAVDSNLWSRHCCCH
jgi:hypothetical protein